MVAVMALVKVSRLSEMIMIFIFELLCCNEQKQKLQIALQNYKFANLLVKFFYLLQDYCLTLTVY